MFSSTSLHTFQRSNREFKKTRSRNWYPSDKEWSKGNCNPNTHVTPPPKNVHHVSSNRRINMCPLCLEKFEEFYHQVYFTSNMHSMIKFIIKGRGRMVFHQCSWKGWHCHSPTLSIQVVHYGIKILFSLVVCLDSSLYQMCSINMNCMWKK